MSTVIRGPLWADLAGVWPETPWLLEQAARPRQATSASTTTLTEVPGLPPRGAPLREQLQSFLGALPQMEWTITAAFGLAVATARSFHHYRKL